MSPSDRKGSNVARMANVVLGVVRDYPNSTTAEVIAHTYRRLANWSAFHEQYPPPEGVTPLHGLRKLERNGKVECVRDDGRRWILRPRVTVGAYGRIEETA